MKAKQAWLTAVIMLGILLALCGMVSASRIRVPTEADWGERDEVREKYELSPGARVSVSSISGPVELLVT